MIQALPPGSQPPADWWRRIVQAVNALIGRDTAIIAEQAAQDAAIASKAPSSRTIATSAPLTGGGDLTADRTLGVSPATGWSTPTGTLSRAAFDQSTATPADTAQHLAALITDLKAKGYLAS